MSAYFPAFRPGILLFVQYPNQQNIRKMTATNFLIAQSLGAAAHIYSIRSVRGSSCGWCDFLLTLRSRIRSGGFAEMHFPVAIYLATSAQCDSCSLRSRAIPLRSTLRGAHALDKIL